MASIVSRLEKLEQVTGGRGGCKVCWSWDTNWERCVVIAQNDAEAQIPHCPSCGREPEQILIRRYYADVEAV